MSNASLRVMSLLAALTPLRVGAEPPAGPDDALGTAGFFTDLAGDTAVRERARQEAAAQAQEALRDQPPGTGVVMHLQIYRERAPESAFQPQDAQVFQGGMGSGKTEAIRAGENPAVHPARFDRERVGGERIYFEKQPDNSLRQERVTRSEVERVQQDPRDTAPPAPALPPPAAAPAPAPSAPLRLERDTIDLFPAEPRVIPRETWEAFERSQKTG